MKIKPKFNIDDIVAFDDDFHFNAESETVSIGKIEAIHIYTKYGKNNILIADSRITYTVSGFNTQPNEDDLVLYSE